ncbi:ribosomal protein L7Ae family protein [Lachnospiraceae bacterium TWA4]|nr:ribosomal protein L7Ae family protein [Lachnospiraceae bacterium TWA4]
MKPDKVLSLLGLSKKAGKIESGNFCVEKAVKAGKAYLVLIANDASANTKKDIENMCSYYEVPWKFYGDKDSLGTAIGNEYRVCVALTDEGFAKAIEKLL